MSNIRPFGGVGKIAEPAPPATYYAVCTQHGAHEVFRLLEPFDMRAICPFCVADWFVDTFPVTVKEAQP
jgi:hypothetical protein